MSKSIEVMIFDVSSYQFKGIKGMKKRELLICRCEEVTEEEIRQAVRDGADTVSGVKRRTRAGMGLCQGHTCSKLVARIIAEETGKPLAEILSATVRPPVRPLSARVLSVDTEKNGGGFK